MSDWLEIVVTVLDEADAEAAAEVLQLFAIGDEGVAIEQIGDPDDLDPRALLPETLVKLYVDVGRDSAEFRHNLSTTVSDHNLPAPTFTVIKTEDWANAWKENFHPMRIGSRFWIKPSWVEAAPPNDDDITLHLDPGMAFGTGKHETTQLCIGLLEDYVRPNMSLFDVGTGSGILAIAAAKLGATPIYAIDNDPLAVEATRINVVENQVDSYITTDEGSVGQVTGEWDLVVVNILAVIILDLFAKEALMQRVKVGGLMILSGILDSQSAEMIQMVEAHGGQVLRQEAIGDWIALVVQRSV